MHKVMPCELPQDAGIFLEAAAEGQVDFGCATCRAVKSLSTCFRIGLQQTRMPKPKRSTRSGRRSKAVSSSKPKNSKQKIDRTKTQEHQSIPCQELEANVPELPTKPVPTGSGESGGELDMDTPQKARFPERAGSVRLVLW